LATVLVASMAWCFEPGGLLYCTTESNERLCTKLFLYFQDVASKIMAFSQQGPRTTCIISANGALCTATLRQPATSGGIVTYEVHSGSTAQSAG
jgi:hypothetical protein